MNGLAIGILLFVTAERGLELVWSRSNTRRLINAGGIEQGAGHYPLMVVLHGAWLVGLWATAWDRPVEPVFLAIFALAQIGRGLVLFTLGRRWTTRIVVVPGERLVSRGPYRYLRHPNYAVVAVEIAALPLAFGMVAFALVFSVLNAVVLAVRIRAEETALAVATKATRNRETGVTGVL